MQRLSELKSSSDILVETSLVAGKSFHTISLDKGLFFWTEGLSMVSYEPQNRAYANMYNVIPTDFDFRSWVWSMCHD